jgi:hypothetical protein
VRLSGSRQAVDHDHEGPGTPRTSVTAGTRDTAQGYSLQDDHASDDFRRWRVAVIGWWRDCAIWAVEGLRSFGRWRGCGHLSCGGCAIPGPNCRIRPGNPVGHSFSPPVTTSMLHPCRRSDINAPLMPFRTAGRTGESGTSGISDPGRTSGTACSVSRVCRSGGEPCRGCAVPEGSRVLFRGDRGCAVPEGSRSR